MYKTEVIDIVAEKMNLPKITAAKCVNAVFDTITDVVADGETVTITGFGKFFPRERRERMGHNPLTGEKVHIPTKTVPVFRAGDSFRKRLA